MILIVKMLVCVILVRPQLAQLTAAKRGTPWRLLRPPRRTEHNVPQLQDMILRTRQQPRRVSRYS